VCPISRLVHCQRHRTAIIKEVLDNTMRASIVRRCIASDEVRQHVDSLPLKLAGCGNAMHGNSNVRLSVVAKNEGVCDGEHELLLACRRVLFAGDEWGVVVTDGCVFRSVGGNHLDRDGEERQGFEIHLVKIGERR
jgi:acyl CoA:acetate/3-ketoacid CoA transferase beta subunit